MVWTLLACWWCRWVKWKPPQVCGIIAAPFQDECIIFPYATLFLVERDSVSCITEFSCGEEGRMCETWDDVGLCGGIFKPWDVDVTGVGRG